MASLAILMAGIVLTVLAIGVVTVLLQRGPLELPQLRSLLEDRINTQTKNHDVKIGSIALMSSETGVGNRVLLKDVVVLGANGEQLMAVPELRTRFSLLDLVNGRVAPEDVSIVGTELSLDRDENGTISLFGSGKGVASGANFLELLDALNEQTGLAALTRVELENTRVTFRDHLTQRGWVVDNSALSITRDGETVSGRAVLELGKRLAMCNNLQQ